MIEVSELKSAVADESLWVVFDQDGAQLDIPIPKDTGSATMLVAPVNEALKIVDEGQVMSINRNGAWAVEAFALDHVVVGRLASGSLTPSQLHDAVVEMGMAWQFSQTAP